MIPILFLLCGLGERHKVVHEPWVSVGLFCQIISHVYEEWAYVNLMDKGSSLRKYLLDCILF